MIIKKNSNSIFNKLVYTAIIITVFSQILVLKEVIKYPMYLLWIALFLCILIKNKVSITFSKFTIFFIGIYAFLSIIVALNMIFRENYKISGLYDLLLLPLFIYLIGYWGAKIISKDVINNCIIIYAGCVLILGIQICLMYIPSISFWLNSPSYFYGAKNSAGQLFISAVLLLIFVIKPKRKSLFIFKWIAVVILLIECILVQCRTALVGFSISILIYVFINSKHRLRYIVVGSIFIIIALAYEPIRGFIEHSFLLDKYAGEGLDTVSSGRFTYFQNAWNVFNESPFFGAGKHYIDNLYLCALAELGLICGVPLITLWMYRIKLNIKLVKLDKNNLIKVALLCITTYYIITSMLEAYPPFGPGVSSFMFWLLCGYCDRKEH